MTLRCAWGAATNEACIHDAVIVWHGDSLCGTHFNETMLAHREAFEQQQDRLVAKAFPGRSENRPEGTDR